MKRIAVVCCVSLLQASLAAAEPGPLRNASGRKDPQRLLRAETLSPRHVSEDDHQDTGNWMERHPVWAGTMIGFAAGFLITYAVAGHEDHNPDQIFKGIPPSGPALVFGGVAAGVGALAGWGIRRSRDKNPNPDLGGSAAVAGRQVR